MSSVVWIHHFFLFTLSVGEDKCEMLQTCMPTLEHFLPCSLSLSLLMPCCMLAYKKYDHTADKSDLLSQLHLVFLWLPWSRGTGAPLTVAFPALVHTPNWRLRYSPRCVYLFTISLPLLPHFVQVSTLLHIVQIKICFPLGLRNFSSESLLEHRLLKGQPLVQVSPLEPVQVLHRKTHKWTSTGHDFWSEDLLRTHLTSNWRFRMSPLSDSLT